MRIPAKIGSARIVSARAATRAETNAHQEPSPNGTYDLRAEYDLSKLKGGVRVNYFARDGRKDIGALELDVAGAFPDGRTVNQACEH